MQPRPSHPLTLALRLVVTYMPDGRWIAHAELPDGAVQHFSSPFELARFVARVPVVVAGQGRGLR